MPRSSQTGRRRPGMYASRGFTLAETPVRRRACGVHRWRSSATNSALRRARDRRRTAGPRARGRVPARSRKPDATARWARWPPMRGWRALPRRGPRARRGPRTAAPSRGPARRTFARTESQVRAGGDDGVINAQADSPSKSATTAPSSSSDRSRLRSTSRRSSSRRTSSSKLRYGSSSLHTSMSSSTKSSRSRPPSTARTSAS